MIKGTYISQYDSLDTEIETMAMEIDDNDNLDLICMSNTHCPLHLQDIENT